MMSLADWWYSSFGQEETEESKAIRKVMDSVENSLEQMPSVDLVRCKDCKHYRISGTRVFGIPVTRCVFLGAEDVDEDDFCSYGKRKEHEGNG